MQKEDIITGKVTGIAFGGQGILRHEGFVIFVPFTLPGETISCRITDKKKSFATGELIELIARSPDRIEPSCPYYGKCGGCQLQHMNYHTQMKYKQGCVADALKRIGGIPADVVEQVTPSQLQWAYRRHIALTLIPHKGRFSAGYVSVDNQELVSIGHCPIFTSQLDPIIRTVQDIAERMESTPDNEGRVSILKQGNVKYILNFSLLSLPGNYEQVSREVIAKSDSIVGILVSTQQGTKRFGDTVAACTVEGLNFEFSPDVFIQNHPEQSGNIYRRVCDIAEKTGSKKILDLYCGIGITTILLAKQGADVVGVEFNREAIRWANKNASGNGLDGVKFIQGDVQAVLKNALRANKPDLVIVNPPRTGMDPDVTRKLLEYSPKHVIYISCMPSTLARDLKQFYEKNYQITTCKPFDMFPQTAHVETVVHLQLMAPIHHTPRD